jgi:Putative transposase
LAAHPELFSAVLQIIHRVIATFLIKRAGVKRSEADTGAVTLIQRFGSAANLNIHLHCLVLDGIYLGVLAPNANLRSEIVPCPTENTSEHEADHAHCTPARISWARLLKRVFDVNIEHCPQCGGRLKLIAAIEEAPVIVRILAHLGLPIRAPLAPAVGTARIELIDWASVVLHPVWNLCMAIAE